MVTDDDEPALKRQRLEINCQDPSIKVRVRRLPGPSSTCPACWGRACRVECVSPPRSVSAPRPPTARAPRPAAPRRPHPTLGPTCAAVAPWAPQGRGCVRRRSASETRRPLPVVTCCRLALLLPLITCCRHAPFSRCPHALPLPAVRCCSLAVLSLPSRAVLTPGPRGSVLGGGAGGPSLPVAALARRCVGTVTAPRSGLSGRVRTVFITWLPSLPASPRRPFQKRLGP